MSSPDRLGWKINSKDPHSSTCSATASCVPDLNLANLPTDVLLKIFSLCGPENWPFISLVCKRFYFILGPDSFLWEQIARRLLVVNQISPTFCSKLHTTLPPRYRCQVYKNWGKGACLVKPISVIHDKHVIPWLIQKSDTIWVGAAGHIDSYTRTPPVGSLRKFPKKRQICHPPALQLKGSRGDFGRFVVNDGVVVAGDTCGTLRVWRACTGRLQFKKDDCHESEVAAVGLYKNVIVSGGRDRAVKIWQHSWRNICAMHEINLEDRILSLDIDPSGRFFCTGSGGHHSVPPSNLFDLASGALICPLRKYFRSGEGVYDVHFESPNEVLTADFNSALRLWDVRTKSNVAVWDDPHDSAINCIASDNNVTILTGTAAHGGVRLWDKRQRQCVQLYFVRPESRSPVYSLDFDSSEMFVCLDTSVVGFDFSAGPRQPGKDLVVFPGH